MIELMFFVSAAITLICALLSISSHNVVHALLFMVLMMLAIALIFFLLGAPFAAALQIIVYAGAIMVLFIFVTMMLHLGQKSIDAEKSLFNLRRSWLELFIALVLLAQVVYLLFSGEFSQQTSTVLPSNIESTKDIGIQLFGAYYQLIILAALMLLSALISAIHISNNNTKRNTMESS